MYHKVPDQELNTRHKTYVTQKNFEKHLRFFKKRGFSTLTFHDLYLYRTGQKDFKDFPKKPLILTFDDGYLDNIKNVRPLLQQYGFKAQIFLLADRSINTSFWDKPDDHPIASHMERSAWMCQQFEIGSHGLNHKKMTEMNWDEKIWQLKESKKLLENEFGVTVRSFAFPFGLSNHECALACQEAGYDYGLNTDTGGLTLEENPYHIFRVNMFPDETLWSLWKKTSSWYRKYYFFKRNQ
jgi:peptidoglycan/xylan/chitin deacetylase (PgdA/CDA1 family)